MVNEISSYGDATITIPASQKVAIFSYDDVSAFSQAGYPNYPNTDVAEFTTTGGVHYVSAAYTAATQITLKAGASPAYYVIGSAPFVPGVNSAGITANVSDFIIDGLDAVSGSNGAGGNVTISSGSGDGSGANGLIRTRGIFTKSQASPNAQTVSATLTIGQIAGGLITGTHAVGSNQTYTLPTGTLSDSGLSMSVNDSFEWSLINLSAAAADTVTVAAGAGHTVVGVMVVQSAHATTGGLYGNVGRFLTRKTATNTFVTYRIA